MGARPTVWIRVRVSLAVRPRPVRGTHTEYRLLPGRQPGLASVCFAAAASWSRQAAQPGLVIAVTFVLHEMASKTVSEQARCGFLTDVEGNYEYFESYVQISKIIEWEDQEKKDRLKFKDDNCYFVFGGDTQDKGTGDIRFVKVINALKEKHPDRVILIIGNRDANKLRLTTELGKQALESEEVLNDPEFPYWLTPDKRVTPAQYLKANSLEDTAVSRLKWILK